MLGGEHRVDWGTTFPFNRYYQEHSSITGHPRTKGDVNIGNDVWIGREALILSGISIGDGAVVAARAVVTRNVAPYSIVAGNPARHIRHRFGEDQVKELLRLAWWNWPDDVVRKAAPLLLTSDLSGLIRSRDELVVRLLDSIEQPERLR